MFLFSRSSKGFAVRTKKCAVLISVALFILVSWLPISANPLVRTIVLETGEAHFPFVTVPTDTTIQLKNNFTETLIGTSIQKTDTGKRMVNIESFLPGQTIGLEFPKKGMYSVCYSLKTDSQSANPRCLEIHVVKLQTA